MDAVNVYNRRTNHGSRCITLHIAHLRAPCLLLCRVRGKITAYVNISVTENIASIAAARAALARTRQTWRASGDFASLTSCNAVRISAISNASSSPSRNSSGACRRISRTHCAFICCLHLSSAAIVRRRGRHAVRAARWVRCACAWTAAAAGVKAKRANAAATHRACASAVASCTPALCISTSFVCGSGDHFFLFLHLSETHVSAGGASGFRCAPRAASADALK